MSALPNIVLVHGAWADGSSWSAVIQRLQADGYTVTAPQFPMTRLADDVARLRQVLALQPGSRCRPGSWSPTATRRSRPMPTGSSPLAWAPPPWRSPPTTWRWSPTQMRCCSSSRRPPRRCRPQPKLLVSGGD
jgi:hypothetical protein